MLNLHGLTVVRTDRELACPHIDTALIEAGANLELLPDGVNTDELLEAVAEASLILMCYTPISAEIIKAAPQLKGIVKYGVGIDAIDIAAAKARGIPVVNVPQYAERTVAEGAFCLLLALAKKLLPIDRAMKSQGWFWPEAPWLAHEVAGKTVGLVGLGHIGRSMAQMAGAGFDARIIAHDPFVSRASMHAGGVEKIDTLQQLLSQSDFVSLHCVLTPQTHHLIGTEELKLMKPEACLINVSRGALIDEHALLVALQSGALAGAALDVFSDEPLNRTDHALRALYDLDNVILSPHMTFYTHEAMQRLEEETLQRCEEIISHRCVLVKSTDPRLTSQTQGVRFNS